MSSGMDTGSAGAGRADAGSDGGSGAAGDGGDPLASIAPAALVELFPELLVLDGANDKVVRLKPDLTPSDKAAALLLLARVHNANGGRCVALRASERALLQRVRAALTPAAPAATHTRRTRPAPPLGSGLPRGAVARHMRARCGCAERGYRPLMRARHRLYRDGRQHGRGRR